MSSVDEDLTPEQIAGTELCLQIIESFLKIVNKLFL